VYNRTDKHNIFVFLIDLVLYVKYIIFLIP